jgi:hypothetical protein
MGTLLVGARMLLTLVFATAGVAKLLDRSGTRRALSDFGVPVSALTVGSILLPLAELATALALIPAATAQWGGVAAMALLLGFSAGIALAMREGKAPDCHCFGQLHSAPAGRNTLLRNLALVVPAAFVAVKGPGPTLSSWVADRTAAELVAAASGLAAVVLGSLALRYWRENRILNNHLEGARAELAVLPTGLPVGAVAPDFFLSSARTGETVTLEELCALGRPVALFFVSTSCGSCAEAFADAGRWQTTLARDLTVAIISDGDPAENLRAVGNDAADVLIQKTGEVNRAYRIRGTPTALVISPQRRIASGLVSANPALESLIRLTVRQQTTGQFNGASAAVQPARLTLHHRQPSRSPDPAG